VLLRKPALELLVGDRALPLAQHALCPETIDLDLESAAGWSLSEFGPRSAASAAGRLGGETPHIGVSKDDGVCEFAVRSGVAYFVEAIEREVGLRGESRVGVETNRVAVHLGEAVRFMGEVVRPDGQPEPEAVVIFQSEEMGGSSLLRF
jgi:hypothetical protein